MKKKGILTPEQSRFLGGVFGSPLVATTPDLREEILGAYLQSREEGTTPEDIDDDIKRNVQYAIATSEKAQEMPLDADPEDIVAETPSPFALEEVVIDPTE